MNRKPALQSTGSPCFPVSEVCCPRLETVSTVCLAFWPWRSVRTTGLSPACSATPPPLLTHTGTPQCTLRRAHTPLPLTSTCPLQLGICGVFGTVAVKCLAVREEPASCHKRYGSRGSREQKPQQSLPCPESHRACVTFLLYGGKSVLQLRIKGESESVSSCTIQAL